MHSRRQFDAWRKEICLYLCIKGCINGFVGRMALNGRVEAMQVSRDVYQICQNVRSLH